MAIAPGEQPTNLRNVLKFVARNPKAIGVLARKIRKRLTDGTGRYTEKENIHWITERAVSPAELATRLAPELWREALSFGEEARARADLIMPTVPFDMGAGGDYQFLYWLTRYRRPSIVVETGVSAGWSSYAFLRAMEVNGRGELHSSDFPYFRVQNPEKYVGILVPTELRKRWNMHLSGDEIALPKIFSSVQAVDLFHYDSDKSISGRDFGVAQAKPKLAPRGLVLVDDIRNDSWFREYVERSREDYTILDGRCGMLGEVR